MRVSFDDTIEGGRIVQAIGRLRATTSWHGPDTPCESGDWQVEALRALMRTAEEFEADAVVDVGYETDDIDTTDLAPIKLRRVTAVGTAVKLARG